MENTTTIWPAISACLGNIALIWYIIELTTQEKDLLRRSQPNHYGQLGLFRTEFGRCIFGRIETAWCLVSTAISLFERFHCGRGTTNWPGVSIPFQHFEKPCMHTSCHEDMAFLCFLWAIVMRCLRATHRATSVGLTPHISALQAHRTINKFTPHT